LFQLRLQVADVTVEMRYNPRVSPLSVSLELVNRREPVQPRMAIGQAEVDQPAFQLHHGVNCLVSQFSQPCGPLPG
jgi:hypothetical protein